MTILLFCYLHQVAGNEGGTAGTAGLAVHINKLAALSMIQQELDTDCKILLCWRCNQVRCAENQVIDAKIRPLLPPCNNSKHVFVDQTQLATLAAAAA